jgi:hypothetical protein
MTVLHESRVGVCAPLHTMCKLVEFVHPVALATMTWRHISSLCKSPGLDETHRHTMNKRLDLALGVFVRLL